MTEFEPGWTVTDPSGEVVQRADGPSAATLSAISESMKGGDNGSDRAGAGEPDPKSHTGH
jgi:hypothetical protein